MIRIVSKIRQYLNWYGNLANAMTDPVFLLTAGGMSGAVRQGILRGTLHEAGRLPRVVAFAKGVA